ncbi:purine-nucleoside phosphorylase [Sporomusaceae bacterium BoRhaA]|nr:purine-nucleoside phosphorylase [Pelorhabdus rhamnosifermentans]
MLPNKAKFLSVFYCGEAATAEERQTSFNDMIEIALETAIQNDDI